MNLQNCDLFVSADHRVKLKEIDKKDKYVPQPWQGIEKAVEHKSEIIPIVIGALGTVTEWLMKGRFKRLINTISHEKTRTWLRKGNFNRETESLLIAAQNNAIRTNSIKARKDKTQQNSKCRLNGNRDETIT